MEQYVQEPAAESDLNQKRISELATIDNSEDNSSSSLECNICLDFVQDPVVTFCGHLFCWPCIYKWIHFQSVPSKISEPQCPICKAGVSKETLIPLYAGGLTSPKPSNTRAPQLGIAIPQRPPSPRCGGHLLQTIASPPTNSRAVPQLHPRLPAQQNQSNQHSISSSDTMNLGDMIFDGIFGFSAGTALYSYPTSYSPSASGSPRLRRNLMKVERSLSRVYLFLGCCVIVCLLSF